jgi:predicted HicB family RNase H-like nuclease
MKAKTNNQNKNRTLDAAMEAVRKEEDTLFTIRMSKSLHKQLKTRAAEDNTTIRRILTELVTRFLDNNITI